jgi:20S proteasome subunit beta 5
MNSLVQRFSTSSSTPLAALHKAAKVVTEEDDDFSDAGWGSDAGFGNIAKGVPSFAVPAVADVRISLQPLFAGGGYSDNCIA